MIPYLLHSSLLLAFSFLFYWVFLKKETFYKANRITLVSMLAISLLLPLAKIPVSWSLQKSPIYQLNHVDPSSHESINGKEFPKNNKKKHFKKDNEVLYPNKPLSIGTLLLNIYIVGVAIFTIAFLVQLIKILINRRKLEYIQDKSYRIYELTSNTPPFSFLNDIFINPALYDLDTYNQIIDHEKIHIQQKHYMDKILAELLVIFFWFNPFVWFMRNSITNNLEFLTDDEMINNGVDSESYQMSLLKVSVNQHPLNLTTNYNQSILKKRISMMNSKKSSFRSSWKYITVLPVFILSVFSLNATKNPTSNNTTKVPVSHTETIEKVLKFNSNSDDNLLMIANVTGGIEVVGYNGSEVKIVITKNITGANDKDIQQGINEINISTIEQGKKIFVVLDSPYSSFDKENESFSHSENCGSAPCYPYQFRLDYKVFVPTNTNLILETVNSGDIKLENVENNSLKIKHITGSILLDKVNSKKSELSTISGNIEAVFTGAPTLDSSFKTVSGFIELQYPKNLKAKVKHKAGDGVFSSDFTVDDKFVKNNRIKSPFTISNGGPTIILETTSGDIKLKNKP